MKKIVLGSTGLEAPQNGFGALPIQRVSVETAAHLLQKAYAGGVRFFDTARAYSDSEEKIGKAFEGIDRASYILATKTGSTTPEAFWKDLETSLSLLKTDYIDIYQFHNPGKVFKPGDGTGMYEAMEEAKRQGKIRHIGITAHKLGNAREAIESGLYETLQYPFSYLSTDKEKELVRMTNEANMGFIAMKGLAGGLINKSDAAMAFMSQFDGVMPIWGIQRESELDEWLSYMENTPEMDEEHTRYIDSERKELAGEFCRGCGYCMPCPQGIQINQCARMSLMVRRAPSASWLNDYWQQEMAKIETCLHCNACHAKCPYELDTPALLIKNLEDYRAILAGEKSVQ